MLNTKKLISEHFRKLQKLSTRKQRQDKTSAQLKARFQRMQALSVLSRKNKKLSTL